MEEIGKFKDEIVNNNPYPIKMQFIDENGYNKNKKIEPDNIPYPIKLRNISQPIHIKNDIRACSYCNFNYSKGEIICKCCKRELDSDSDSDSNSNENTNIKKNNYLGTLADNDLNVLKKEVEDYCLNSIFECKKDKLRKSYLAIDAEINERKRKKLFKQYDEIDLLYNKIFN